MLLTILIITSRKKIPHHYILSAFWQQLPFRDGIFCKKLLFSGKNFLLGTQLIEKINGVAHLIDLDASA
jgi:hypothetical protein